MTGDLPTPLLPENHEKAIAEIPRDPEVIATFKQLVGAGPLPAVIKSSMSAVQIVRRGNSGPRHDKKGVSP